MSSLRYLLDLISIPSLILSLKPREYGSLVAESPTHLKPMKFTGIIKDMISGGMKTKARVLNFDFVHPPEKVAEHLKLNGGSKVLRIERIRLIKGQPISYTISYIPSHLGEKIDMRDLAVQPLMKVLEDKCNVKVVKGSQIIEATLADSRVASFLEVMTGAPLLRIERVVFDTRNRPIEYISILYRSDRYRYTVDFIRKGSESKARWDYIRP